MGDISLNVIIFTNINLSPFHHMDCYHDVQVDLTWQVWIVMWEASGNHQSNICNCKSHILETKIKRQKLWEMLQEQISLCMGHIIWGEPIMVSDSSWLTWALWMRNKGYNCLPALFNTYKCICIVYFNIYTTCQFLFRMKTT